MHQFQLKMLHRVQRVLSLRKLHLAIGLTKAFSMFCINETAILLDEVMDQALWPKNSLTFP